MWWICGICVVLALFIIYLMQAKEKQNEEIRQKNKELEEQHLKLVTLLTKENSEIRSLQEKKDTLNADIEQISKQAEETSNKVYQQSYLYMQERLSQSADKLREFYQEQEEEYKKQYMSILKDFAREASLKAAEIDELSTTLFKLKESAQAAIELDKHKVLEENKKTFYQIKISEEDLADIQLLKQVINKLHGDPDPVNKVIWEIYYKKPTMDLLGRLTPTGTQHIGIYKITNLENGQCYIGQSVDLRNRLRDHIKAGLGIASSNNRFYSEMKRIGPEKFMYEIIEECSKKDLDERERYWINFYSATDWGYNSTVGNKNGAKKNG